MPNDRTRIAVLGQGYVGLPVAMRAVDAGFTVIGFDVDDLKVAGLRDARSPIEDVTDVDISRALSSNRYLPTSDHSDLANFDFAIITVPTPLRDGNPDFGYIESAANLLGPYISVGSTVVLESTTYPGCTEDSLRPILESASGLTAGVDFFLGFSPERIDPGNPNWNFRNTPKIVSGINQASLDKIKSLYDELVDATVAVRGTREAELAKLLENTFRHVNIALVNELAMHAKALNVDIWDVVEASSTKPFGFMRFNPGPGVGGHCLPIDPTYLSWRVNELTGVAFRFVEAANDVNDSMPHLVVDRVVDILNNGGIDPKSARILIVGLAYKKNSSDIRESPSLKVIELLTRSVGATVVAHDPHVRNVPADYGVSLCELSNETISSVDVAIIMTDHDEIDFAVLQKSAKRVFDCRNVISGHNVETF